MQEHLQESSTENLTRLTDGDELDLHAARGVDSYEVGRERAQAAELAERSRTLERPLMPHERIAQVSTRLEELRRSLVWSQNQPQSNPDDYELIA